MRKIIAILLFLLLLPAVSFGEYHGYRHGPPSSSYGPRGGHYSGHHHGDEWVVPLVIVGSVLGIMALSQMPPAQPPPPPPQRICRDTYDYYDEYGQYLYSRYVDRPCY